MGGLGGGRFFGDGWSLGEERRGEKHQYNGGTRWAHEGILYEGRGSFNTEVTEGGAQRSQRRENELRTGVGLSDERVAKSCRFGCGISILPSGLSGASSRGRLAKRARYIVPLHEKPLRRLSSPEHRLSVLLAPIAESGSTRAGVALKAVVVVCGTGKSAYATATWATVLSTRRRKARMEGSRWAMGVSSSLQWERPRAE